MKPVISASVYKTLRNLIFRLKSPEGKLLGEEIEKAEIVSDEVLEKNIVSLGSLVEYKDDAFSQPIRMQIVLPEHADLSKRKISVFAPISVALIGFRESDVFKWKMSAGTKTLHILKVVNV